MKKNFMRSGLVTVFGFCIALVALLLWVFPNIWMLLTSLTLEQDAVAKDFSFLPIHPTFANYAKAFHTTSIMVWMLNSFIVAVATTVLTVVVDAPIAYAFARIKFPGREVLFWLVMAGMMVPFQVLVIPLYLQFNSYGLINTLAAIVLPRLALPIGVFILKQFFEGVPYALEEAAYIDGANRSFIFRTIMIPLAKSAIVTVIIISFINSWNDFLWPLVAVSQTANYTITVGIANFQGVHGTEYTMIMAGAAIASLPLFIFYCCFRKQIVAGLAMTGIKG